MTGPNEPTDLDDFEEGAEGDDSEQPAAQPAGPRTSRGRSITSAGSEPQSASRPLGEPETLPYVDDPVSKVWVGVVVGVFAVVFLYAVLLGHGGLLSPARPTIAPLPTGTPAASVSASPIESASTSPTASASPSSSVPSPSATPSGAPHGPSIAPSASPSVEPTVTAAPSASPSPSAPAS